jgi:hypothetical protein
MNERVFRPCQGKDACRENAEGCGTCGRSSAEITETRDLIDTLSQFVIQQGYSNVDDFATYVANHLRRKVTHARQALPLS